MNLKCLIRGHDWVDCSSLQSKGNPRKDVKEVARRCKRKGCDKFEFIRDEPLKKGGCLRWPTQD